MLFLSCWAMCVANCPQNWCDICWELTFWPDGKLMERSLGSMNNPAMLMEIWPWRVLSWNSAGKMNESHHSARWYRFNRKPHVLSDKKHLHYKNGFYLYSPVAACDFPAIFLPANTLTGFWGWTFATYEVKKQGRNNKWHPHWNTQLNITKIVCKICNVNDQRLIYVVIKAQDEEKKE